MGFAGSKEEDPATSDRVFRDSPVTSCFVTRSVLLDTGGGRPCPLLAAHVTKREWILSLALTSFKEIYCDADQGCPQELSV